MASEENNPLAESGVTMNSDSEQYSAGEDLSTSPEDSAPSPQLVLYQPPTTWSLLRGVAINLLLPFINGMMLGFGELFAHEAAFRLGWGGTRVCLLLPCCDSFRRTLGLSCDVYSYILTSSSRSSLYRDEGRMR